MKIRSLLFILVLISSLRANHQLWVRGGAESGLYFQNSVSTQVLSTFLTSINYRQSLYDGQLDLKCRLAPRFYHPENFTSIKLNFNIDYQKNIGSNWLNLRTVLKKNWYESDAGFSFSYNLLQLNSTFTKPFSRKQRISLELGIYNRNFSNNYFNKMTGYSGHIYNSLDLLEKVRFGTGIHIERFRIENPQKHSELNEGFRFGPLLSIGLRSNYIATVTITYNWLIYDVYQATDRNFHIVLLTGRYISSNISMFIYTNLYQGTSAANIPLELIYRPVTDENNLYMKLGYDIKNNSEIYLKFGYQQEELFNSNHTFSGVQLLAGLSLKN